MDFLFFCNLVGIRRALSRRSRCAREGRQVEAWEEWNWWCKLSLVREGGVAGGGEWLDGRNAEGRGNAKESWSNFNR